MKKYFLSGRLQAAFSMLACVCKSKIYIPKRQENEENRQKDLKKAKE